MSRLLVPYLFVTSTYALVFSVLELSYDVNLSGQFKITTLEIKLNKKNAKDKDDSTTPASLKPTLTQRNPHY